MVLYDDPRHTAACEKFDVLLDIPEQRIILAYDNRNAMDVGFRQLRERLDPRTKLVRRNYFELTNGTRIFLEPRDGAARLSRGLSNVTIIW